MTTNTDPMLRKPALRRSDANDMIPAGLIRAMFGLALAALALVTYAVATDRPLVAVPPDARVTAEYRVILVGGGAQAVTVLDADGRLIDAMDHGGFVTVIQNGLQHERRKNGLSPELPLRIVAFANGRLSAIDEHTGFRVELGAFGDDNRAAFERLIEKLN